MIDAHHHLWNFTEQEFSWLEPSLQRSFLANDLEQTIANTGVTGTIAVQARCSLEENDFLLEQATKTPLIKGIVGWADLTANNAADTLSQLASNSIIKGIREITQGTPDQQFLANDKFNTGVDLLVSNNLTYDLLIFENQLDIATQFVAKHPDLPIVLDHCAKPSIQQHLFPEHWAANIKQLAKFDNLSCKLSGLPTEIRDGSVCHADLLRPYFDTILEAFGPKRIMFGSDWPVSLGATPYTDWMATLAELCSSLSSHERTEIMSNTATRFYGIEKRL